MKNFYNSDFNRATRRLGWISAPARKFILGRHALRTLGCLDGTFSSRAGLQDKMYLKLFRALLETQLIGELNTSKFSAPYMPSGHPEVYFVSVARGEHLFCLDTRSSASPDIAFFDEDNEGKTTFVFATDEVEGLTLADQLLVDSILRATQGTNLSTKRKVDFRCTEMSNEQLWLGSFNNNVLRKKADRLFRRLKQRGDEWIFWHDWYQSLVDGKPIDLDMQIQVAKIKEEHWIAGPVAVASEIDRIKANKLIAELPQAEAIELNQETGKFYSTPVSVQNAPLLSAMLTSISDALEDALHGANGLSERSSEFRKITRIVKRYGNNPQQAELTLTTVAKGLRRQLHETQELPDSEDNLALLDAIEEGVRGIRANHPEVAANREQLARQTFKELNTESKGLLENAQPILVELSEGDMAADFAEDIPSLVNDNLLPLPIGAPALPAADAATRIFSRTSKMALLIDKAAELHDSKGNKTVRLFMQAGTVAGMFAALVRIGLKLLGVI